MGEFPIVLDTETVMGNGCHS